MIKRLLLRALEFAFEQPDRICQDPNAQLYGEYRGVMVDLVPVVDATGRIVRWELDKVMVDEIDRSRNGVPFAAAATPAASAQPSPGLPGLNLP